MHKHWVRSRLPPTQAANGEAMTAITAAPQQAGTEARLRAATALMSLGR
jgi:hypothetical protein